MKNKFIVAAGASLLLPSIIMGSANAADPSITINNSTDNLYTQGFNPDHTVTYDAANNVLKLSNFHGDRVVISNIDDITITLEGENTLSMASYGNAGSDAKAIYAPNTNLTINGDGKLTVADQTPNDFKINASDVIVMKNFILNGATMDLSFNTGACIGSDSGWGTKSNITINSGSLKLSKCLSGMSTIDTFAINGGLVDISDVGNPTGTYGSLTKNLKVTGGILKVANSTSAIHVSNSIDVSGGEIKVDTTNSLSTPIQIDKDSANNGSDTKRYFSISGGKLEINAKQCGISVKDADSESYINFAGGTTIINNPNTSCSSVNITYGQENNPNIILSENVKLSPSDALVKMKFTKYTETWKEYMYYLTSETSDMKKLVITDSGESEGNPSNPENTNKDDSEDVPVPNTSAKSPNTGENTNNQNYAIVASIILPVLLGITMGIRYFVRSRKSIKLY